MLSSFRKRRVQVFDPHAGNALPFASAWFAVKTLGVREVGRPGGGGLGPHAFSVKVPVRVGFFSLVLVLCEQKS